jgi:mannose-6-phosphate isomerase-like protein (cupin superfamily)
LATALRLVRAGASEWRSRSTSGQAHTTAPSSASRSSPGDPLARHTDSAEEILYIVAGEAEAEVGDERGRLTGGDLAVISALVPHGLANVGTETVEVVGFFSESEIISSFDEPVQPFGIAVLNQGAPAPVPA